MAEWESNQIYQIGDIVTYRTVTRPTLMERLLAGLRRNYCAESFSRTFVYTLKGV